MIITFTLLVLLIISFIQNDSATLHQKRELCDVIKFIAALLVINGHLFLFGFKNEYWIPEMNLGAQCVAIFFFFSGYGLVHSYRTKGETYLHNFFTKRIVKIIIPLLTAYAVYLPVKYFVVGPFEWSEVFFRLFSADSFLKFSWYVSEITLLYLLFYTAFSLPLSTINKNILLSTFTLILMLILSQLENFCTYWIYSTPCFILGTWYALFENKLHTIFKNRKTYINTTSCLLILFFFLFRFDLTIGLFPFLSRWRYQYVAYFLVNILFVIIVLATARLIKPTKSTVYGNQIINSSYEIYLNQGTIITLSSCYLQDSFVIYFAIMFGSVLIGMILHSINNLVFKLFQ